MVGRPYLEPKIKSVLDKRDVIKEIDEYKITDLMKTFWKESWFMVGDCCKRRKRLIESYAAVQFDKK